MLYPDAQPQGKSSGSGKPAKPKPKPIPALPAVIYTSFGIQEAEKLRERIKKAEEYRERVREAARNSDKPKQNQKSQKIDSSRQATQPKTPSYDPLSSIRVPRPKPAPASARKETADIGKTEDAASVQAALPDIEAVQGNYGADDPSLERMYAYSNLDLLRVKQDMERRPLTFRLCFEQAQSPREALEFLYAKSPDCNNSELAYLLEQQSLYGGSSPDDANSNDDSDMDLDIDHFAFEYEDHLESRYGYEIKWASGRDTNRLKQLHNLAQATTHIINYLGQEVFDGDEAQASSVFQQQFSQSEAHGQLVVHLGADGKKQAGGPAYGRVPLQGSGEELRKMYLGSAVDIPTIVHEFGHVLDRNVDFTDYLNERVTQIGESRLAYKAYVNLNSDILKWVIEGFAAKQYFARELWADLFMTAVLDPSVSGEKFVVKSIRDVDIDGIFAAFVDPNVIFKCGIDGTCIDKEVKWEDWELAGKVRRYLPEAFRELLSE